MGKLKKTHVITCWKLKHCADCTVLVYMRCVVDTNAAGSGNLEVTVTNPAGSTMYNYVRPIVPGVFGVYFTPTQSGMHLINVSFNGEVVIGLWLAVQ